MDSDRNEELLLISDEEGLIIDIKEYRRQQEIKNKLFSEENRAKIGFGHKEYDLLIRISKIITEDLCYSVDKRYERFA